MGEKAWIDFRLTQQWQYEIKFVKDISEKMRKIIYDFAENILQNQIDFIFEKERNNDGRTDGWIDV